MIQLSLWKICEKSVSCTRLRILLNTICRKPGFNSLRTPLNHGAEKRAMKLWNKHNSVTDQMLPRAGKLYWKNTWQYCIPRPRAQRNSRAANTGAQLRIARLQAPLRGKDKVIIHSPQYVNQWTARELTFFQLLWISLNDIINVSHEFKL